MRSSGISADDRLAFTLASHGFDGEVVAGVGVEFDDMMRHWRRYLISY
mgnify:CR=1 FL=1